VFSAEQALHQLESGGKEHPVAASNGSTDALVAKVNASGTALVYAGYIGGDADDFGFGIAVDKKGNAYVTGNTRSTEASFPLTVGPDLTSNGNFDAFVAKVSETGDKEVDDSYQVAL
jgi:hypothetical protein